MAGYGAVNSCPVDGETEVDWNRPQDPVVEFVEDKDCSADRILLADWNARRPGQKVDVLRLAGLHPKGLRLRISTTAHDGDPASGGAQLFAFDLDVISQFHAPLDDLARTHQVESAIALAAGGNGDRLAGHGIGGHALLRSVGAIDSIPTGDGHQCNQDQLAHSYSCRFLLYW